MDGGQTPVLEVLWMSALCCDSSELSQVNELREPAEIAVTEETGAVQLEGCLEGEMAEGVLLDGADHVLGQVQFFQFLKSQQGLIANRFDGVSGESQHSQQLQVLERRSSVLDCVGKLVSIQQQLLKQGNLLECVCGINVRNKVIPEIEVLQAWKSSQDVPFNNFQLISLQIEFIEFLAEVPSVILDIINIVEGKF